MFTTNILKTMVLSRFLDLRVLVYRLFFSDAVYISHFHIAYLYDYFTSELSFEL